jgi:hypothetical protein
MTTYPGGAYIKIAFYGNTCGINAYCTSSFPRRIFLSCYIDNNLTPIVKSLDQALGNILIFADNNLHALDENKPHTAKIYISTIRQPSNNQDRFSWPDAIVVQGILLQRGSNIVDPSTVDDPFNPAFKFKRDKNVLIYGDDNTEMPDVGTDFNPQVLL